MVEKTVNTPRLLLITRYFPPLDGIATMRMYSWAKYLHQRGWQIDVLTTSKRGQTVVPLSFDVSNFHVAELDYFDPILAVGMDKQSIASHEAQPSTGWKAKVRGWAARFYRERMNERMPGRTDPWILPARRELRRRKRSGVVYDYIISSYGPPSAHIMGAYAKKLFTCHWIADYRDLWPENHVFIGLWPFTLLERFIERRLVRAADMITSVSGALCQLLQQKFPHIPVKLIPNGFDKEIFDSVSGGYFDMQPKKYRIVYTGSIFRGRRDPSPLFRALRMMIDQGEIDESSVEVLFYSTTVGNLLELIQEHHVSSFAKHMGSVSQRDAYRIQKSADLLLFLEAPNPEIDGVLTGKLFEYLYVDPPILGIGVNSTTAAGRIIEETGSGMACGNDVAAIRSYLIDLLLGTKRYKQDRAGIECYSRESQANVLADAMEKLK